MGNPACKVLLIDLENCPNQLNNLPTDLSNYLQVVICYAQSNAKVPLNWITPLSNAIAANKLKIIKMEHPGKNSADFGICFFAGVLMQELPKETHFIIMSNDTDLDHTVQLLRSQGRTSDRVGYKKEDEHILEKIKPSQTNSTSLYCIFLITHHKNRPVKHDGLLNSIKHLYKNDPETADSVYKKLIAKTAIKITDNIVSYNEKVIQELANTK